MALSPGALLGFLRRDKAKDPFGGDDMFDGESRFAGKGPKIAIAASAALFLLLVGTVVTIVLTGDKTAGPPVAGSLADLQVDDGPDAAAPAPSTPGAQPADAAAAPTASAPAAVADATAATDRSAQRRPWLTPTAPDAGPRLGVTGTTAGKPATAPSAPLQTAPLQTAPPQTVPAQIAMADAKAPPPAAAKPADSKTAMMTPPPAPAATAAPVKDASPPAKAMASAAPIPQATSLSKADTSKADSKAAVDADAEPDATKDVGGIPALTAAGQAPGAPRRFDLPLGADTGPAVAGGRPRLAEPALPPIDKIAVSAPPPRFANLVDFKKDAKIAPPVASAGKVAFVVEGLGLSQSATDAAITKLPAAVTLAFSPYARDLKTWLEKAKQSGHEVLIELPMESKEFPAEDPGPLGLLTSLDAKENNDRLETILKESGNAIGVLDEQGSKFREDQAINTVFAKLKERNLFYVQGRPGVRVGEASVPTAVADVVVDERPFRAAVDARLDYAERLAKYQGSAVASLSARPVSFERLVLWIDQAQKKGVALAPISQVLIR